MDYLDSVNDKRKKLEEQRQKEFLHKQALAQSKQNTKQILDTLKSDSETTKKVEIVNELASKDDIEDVIEQLKEVQLAALLSNKRPELILANGVNVEDILSPLNDKISAALDTLANSNSNEKLAKQLDKSFSDFSEAMSAFLVQNQEALTDTQRGIEESISKIDVKPVVNVPRAQVSVSAPEVDLSPLEAKLDALRVSIESIPSPVLDTSELMMATLGVQQAIQNMVFPTPNYVLPYKDTNGAAVQVGLTSDGRIPVELGVSPTIDIGDVQIKDTTGTVIDPSTKQNQTSGAQKTQISKSDGTAVGIRDLSETLIATDHALITSTTIHGKTTGGGGGGFVDVKVTPSGALTVENTPATADTGTVTTASVTNSNTTVLASNNQRLGATIYNEGTVPCFVKLGSTASATSYTIRIIVDAYYEVPFGYTGIITGITASGTATLRVTELE